MELVPYIILAVLTALFLILAARDLRELLGHKGQPLGGCRRILAVAGHAWRETMGKKVWLVVPGWFVAVVVVNLFVSPYDEADRMRLYLQVMLLGQILVLNILLGLLATASIPKEVKEKNILIIGAKPLTRLEYLCGKVLGFCGVSAVLVAAMGLLSFGYLWIQDGRIRSRAAAQLEAQQSAYEALERLKPPDALLRDVAEQGTLHARNLIFPEGDLKIVGKLERGRIWLKGGAKQKLRARFANIPVSPAARIQPMLIVRLMSRYDFRGVPEDKREEADPVELSVGFLPRGGGTGMRNPPPIKVNMPIAYGGGQVAIPVPIDVLNLGPVDVDVGTEQPHLYLTWRKGSLMIVGVDPLQTPNSQATIFPQVPIKLVGHERRERQQVKGEQWGQPARGLWRFGRVNLDRFPPGETIPLEIDLSLDRADQLHQPSFAALLIKNEETGKGQVVRFQVQENRPNRVQVRREVFAGKGAVVASVWSETAGHWLGLLPDGMVLILPPAAFFPNLVKCQVIVFLETAVLAAVAVTVSSGLSWPVAVFLALVIYLFGRIKPFLADMSELSGFSAALVIDKLLDLVKFMVPAFGQFQPSEYILDGMNIPILTVGWNVLLAGYYIAPYLMVGFLLLRRREFK